MRYLPLDASERARCCRDRRSRHRRAVRRHSARQANLGLLDMPLTMSEMAVERAMAAMAARNLAAGAAPFFLGAGAYRHHVPAAVDHLIQRSEFLTSYTPYQPEIAQGTLQVLFEFQTQVAMLTGMEVANASLYDGSTACAEAVLMAQRLTRRKAQCSPAACIRIMPKWRRRWRAWPATRSSRLPPDPTASEDIAAAIDEETGCVVVQSPDLFGDPRDLRPIADAAHAKGALLVAVVTELVAWAAALAGRDGRGHRRLARARRSAMGSISAAPMSACSRHAPRIVRQMPGRLAGETVDAAGGAATC